MTQATAMQYDLATSNCWLITGGMKIRAHLEGDVLVTCPYSEESAQYLRIAPRTWVSPRGEQIEESADFVIKIRDKPSIPGQC